MRRLTFVILVALVGTTASAQEYVSRLYDTACLQGESLLTRGLPVSIVGSCESDGSTRLLHISVTNTAPEERGTLHAFTIGFCYADSVIGAQGPSGWVAAITYPPQKERADVSWTVSEALIAEHGLRSGQQASGFAVRLRPGWRRAEFAWGKWESNSMTMMLSRDCEVQMQPFRAPFLLDPPSRSIR